MLLEPDVMDKPHSPDCLISSTFQISFVLLYRLISAHLRVMFPALLTGEGGQRLDFLPLEHERHMCF